MCFQIAKLGQLTEVAFGGGGIEAEMINDNFRRDLVFIGHKTQNIDQFLRQRRFYRPFIDHFLLQR